MLAEAAHARIQALANRVSAAWMAQTAVLQFLDEHSAQAELPLWLPRTKRETEV